MSDEILKSDNLYGYNDGSSLGGSTYSSGGGGDDGDSSPSLENSRDDWEVEYGR